MNKRALIGLIILIVIFIVLVVSGILIFNLSKSGFEIGTGKILLSVDYNLSKNDSVSLSYTNSTNVTNQTILNATNSSSKTENKTNTIRIIEINSSK
jgi:uncharacterized protein YpmB